MAVRGHFSQIPGSGPIAALRDRFRVVGELEEMIEKAREIKQRCLFGIGLARAIKNG